MDQVLEIALEGPGAAVHDAGPEVPEFETETESDQELTN